MTAFYNKYKNKIECSYFLTIFLRHSKIEFNTKSRMKLNQRSTFWDTPLKKSHYVGEYLNKKLMIKCFDYCCNNKSEHSIIKHFLIFFYTFWVNIELIDNTMKKLYWKFEIRVILKILLSLSDCKNDSPKVFF